MRLCQCWCWGLTKQGTRWYSKGQLTSTKEPTMNQESIPLNPNGLPNQDEIISEEFQRLPIEQQEAIKRMRLIGKERKPVTFVHKPEFTPQQIADARRNELRNKFRQQGEDEK